MRTIELMSDEERKEIQRDRTRRCRLKKRDAQLERERIADGLVYPGELPGQPGVNATTIEQEYAALKCFESALQVDPLTAGTTYRQQITKILEAWSKAGMRRFDTKRNCLEDAECDVTFDWAQWIWLPNSDVVIPLLDPHATAQPISDGADNYEVNSHV
jgi:hypothetical protein